MAAEITKTVHASVAEQNGEKNSLRRKCLAITETNGKREKRLHEVAEQFKPPRNKVKEVSLMHFFLKKDF